LKSSQNIIGAAQFVMYFIWEIIWTVLRVALHWYLSFYYIEDKKFASCYIIRHLLRNIQIHW
jgi:hypothetical protein